MLYLITESNWYWIGKLKVGQVRFSSQASNKSISIFYDPPAHSIHNLITIGGGGAAFSFQRLTSSSWSASSLIELRLKVVVAVGAWLLESSALVPALNFLAKVGLHSLLDSQCVSGRMYCMFVCNFSIPKHLFYITQLPPIQQVVEGGGNKIILFWEIEMAKCTLNLCETTTTPRRAVHLPPSRLKGNVI